MKLKKNILLKNYTTFKIGGRAKYFFLAKNKTEIISVVSLVQKKKSPFFILGGGSNLLVSDNGFNGLVIKIQNSKFKIQNSKIITEAGVGLGKLVNLSVKKGLTGLEWAVAIPGTVGGAVYGNAGAFGKSMKNIVKKVEVLNTKDLRFKIYDLGNCKFGYRDSIFKDRKNLIIISTTLQLRKGNIKNIQKKMKEYLKLKKESRPLNFLSAGSIFKNPKGFFAGELIEKSGLKGKKIGKIKISEKHANFIVNLGSGQAKDVKKLINLIKQKVKNKFKIVLEEEICFLN